MTDEMPVGDMIYVSSKRASDISGYAQDYIGQLARSGQIDAKRIGGLWYVSMPSLEAYKTKSESGDLAPVKANQTVLPERDPEVLVSFDGKDYISANRASKITGYNQDYVGQLARSGKILSRQVGNRWYVDRDGILSHKTEKDALLAAVQSESVGLQPLQERNMSSDTRNINVKSEPLLRYHPEELIPEPIIGDDTELDRVNAIPEESNSPGRLTSDQYDIPVQVRRRLPQQEENHQPIDLRSKSTVMSIPLPVAANRPLKQRAKSRTKLRMPGILVAGVVIILIIGSLGALYWRLGPKSAISSTNMHSTVSSVDSSFSTVFNDMMTTFENWIVPTLYYKRSS